MNNKYFRVIFSKVLNCLVVVSELAKSEGKDNKKCGAFLLPFSQFLGKLKPISFRFFCALGFVTFATHTLAETLIIQADKAAPKNQQPIILHTANGLPQVNIQTPNAQGLSHNKYTKFDVDKKGAILNNSASNVKTQQAGWIQGNPYLAKGEAKVILNEVNSHDPSVLKGYVEVAGKKADVIIANPSGLHCDGCGIINAHRATFTTGQAQINNGHLEGFVVEKGRVTVSGKGLDNSKVDYTEILAREVQANAGIWSKKDLKVATGKNYIKRTSAEENLQILHTQEENSAENAPHFAIDVGELGGMYAGKIHLIGTENGVGVRNAGHIGASADSLVIDSRGRIVNTGTLSANNKLDLTTAKNIENSAKVESRQGSIKFNSAENIQQHGIVVALEGNIQMRGENIHQQGKTLAKENIDLHATELNNHDGIILAEDATLNLQVGKLSNKQGAIVAHNLNVKVQNNADNTDGTIQGKESLNLSAQVLNNQNGLIQSANLINLTAKTLVSEGNIKTAGDLNISLQDSFTLNKAFSVGNHLNFSTKGDFANNSALQVKGNVNISANQITNNRDAEISANHTALNAETLMNRGLIDGYKTHVYGKNVTNIGTGRIYGDYLVFNSEYLNNLNENKSSATIGARERLDFAVDKISNHKGSSIISLGNIYFGGKLDDNQQAIGQGSLVENHNALIEAVGDISLNVKKVENLHNLLEVEMRETSKTPVFEYGFANEPTRYAKEGITKVKRGDSGGGLNKKVRNLYALRLPNGRESESWREYNYTRTINETMVIPAEYSEAQILSGGNIHFFSTDVKNYDSKILAHGEISLNNGSNIDNHATEGTVITTEKGRMSYFYNGRACAKKVFGKCIDHYRTTQSYSLPYVNRTETSKNLGLWDYGSLQSSNLTLSTEISSQNVAENVNLVSTPREAHLPTSSLYTINPESPNGYFVETDPKFTQHRQWLSSDYMFNQLRHEHNNVHKRLGDGYYEQRLINEQINQLTGRRFLTGYNNELEQYKALMNEGVKYAKQFDLKLGIALTKEQMSELTTDMVWFVNKVFTLPNGQKVTALVPQVYLVPHHSDITAQGALISANTIIGTLDNVQNSGIIAGRKLTQINAEQINNQGIILGDTVDLSAKQHLINLGGKIEAVDKLSLSAGKNLEIASTLRETKTSTDFARRVVDKMSQLKVSGEKGKLSLQADGDLTVKGALIESQGNIEATAKNIESGTLAVYNKEHYNADADNYYRLNQKTEIGSQFKAKNAVVLLAEQDIHLRQAELSSKQADVTLQSSKGNIDITAGKTEEQVANSIKSSAKGLFSSSTELTRHQHHYTETAGSNIDGESVKVLAEQGKVQVSGSAIVGEQDVAIVAKNGIDIVAETNLSKEQDEHYSRKSGLLGSGGGIGFTIGQKKERTEQEQQTESVAHSQVGSLKGNVTLLTEGDYKQVGSIVTAQHGNATIMAKKVDIEAAGLDYISHYKRTFAQKGLTIAINIPAVQAALAAKNTVSAVKKVGESKNNRINALAAANVGFDALRTVEQAGQAMDATKALANGNMADANISVSITYGQQKNVQSTDTQGTKAEASQINAGNAVNIVAQGAGENSDINVVGSYISGKKSTALSAENAINLLAKEQHHQERSKNKSSGFNAGVAVSYGSNGFAFGITAGGNYGKGYDNGDETSWLASKVGSLQSQTSLSSQKETNIKGSQVLGNKINFKAQNLNIESLQDTMTYKGKQQNVSAQATVGYGASISGSYNQSKVNADYASVKTQAGLFAGDEGFDVEVKEHTDLKGAVITSTSQAEQQNKNRFSTGILTYSDIENHSSHNASGFGLSGGVTVSGGDAPKEVGGVKLKQIGQNNKDGSSKVEFGGVAGVGSQGNWGIAKGLATALAGYVNDKGSENGYTTSAITTSNIQIQDNQAQQSLTGKTAKQTAEEINRAHVHQDVNKTDVAKVRSDLEQDLAIAGNFVDKLSDVGDEIYYRIEKNEDNIFVKEKRKIDCESVECINYRELDVDKLTVPKTKEEALALARMYAHGIMNTNDQDRLAGSIQYGGKDYLENDVLVVRKPYSSIGAELVFTVFERFRAGLNMPSIFGASNASREQTKIWGLLEQYNKNNPDNKVDLKHLSHSLGVSSTKNAMNWASYKDMKFDNTRLEADTVGTSYPMRNSTIGGVLSGGLYDQGYTEKASELFKEGKVSYAVAPGDLVGTGLGLPFLPGRFGLGIGNTDTTGKNFSHIPLWSLIMGDHTKAYYKDETVIKFLNPDIRDQGEGIKDIINYHNKVWKQVGPKTNVIEFNNRKILNDKDKE